MDCLFEMQLTEHISFYNQDCMEAMRQMPDKAFDLAIVDPPYGIGKNWKKDRSSKFYKHESGYGNETIPSAEYFEQLFRVSKNQIVWGGNYYTEFLSPRNGWIIWDKVIDWPTQHTSECEMAWHSMNIPARIFQLIWNGCCRGDLRHGKHPHEKPVALYKWLLSHYAKEGDTILDTHGGSLSIAIACHDLGFSLEAYELDADYYKAACERVRKHVAQGQLFEPKETFVGKQLEI